VKASLKDQAIGAKSVLDAPTLSDSTPQVPLLSSYELAFVIFAWSAELNSSSERFRVPVQAP
ncbi:hypothetical protein, partial [Deinococcus marmoris]|uniref:hypothetical protein n=1 Tax=Deinococcus marmoris TaxID=249408 RepID=UPI0039F11DFD